MLSTTSDTPPPSSTTYTECGAAKRTLTISPGSVLLSIPDSRSTIELQGKTWEYGFTSDAPLELRLQSLGSYICTVNNAAVSMAGDGPHWVCKRPLGADETYEFRFRAVESTSQGIVSDVDKPTAAQPTLIIRTKRNCPTGVSTKPTVDE
jgi:hypothetical protein